MTLSTLLAFLAFFFGFSFLVFIHELGHFVVARWVGIKCTQFAVGMGQAICSWRKGIGFRAGGTEKEYQRRIHTYLKDRNEPELGGMKRSHHEDLTTSSAMLTDYSNEQINRAAKELGLGDTEYRLNWMPLGGYVKMLGQEDMDPAARSDDPDSFNSKSVGARMAVISAGVIMNLVLGMILLAWAFSIGVKFPTNIAGDIVPYSPAWSTYAEGHHGDPAYHGLQPGDKLVALDGKPVLDFYDLKLGVALASPDATLDLEIARAGENKPLHFHLKPVKGADNLLSVGISPPYAIDHANIPDLDKPDDKPTEAHLVSVDGQPVSDFGQLASIVATDPLKPKTLVFATNATGDTITQTVAAMPVLQQTGETDAKTRTAHLLGMRPAVRVVLDPDKKTPAFEAGLRKDDLIARLGDTDWPTVNEIYEIVDNARRTPLALSVWREGKLVELPDVTPTSKGKIGVLPASALDSPIIAAALPDSPAAALNLPAGSRITSINGQPVTNWADMQAAIAAAAPGELDVTYVANIADQPTETGKLALSADDQHAVALAGWLVPQETYWFKPLEVPLQADNVVEAAGLGLSKTKDFMVQAYLTIARLIQGAVTRDSTISLKHLSGPVGIVNVGTTITEERGFPYLLFFLGLLSVNLAVINFLPIPVVDGGHAVFLIIEKLKGSPVSANVQAAATYVGLGFIGLLVIVVTYNDILKLVSPSP